MNVTVNKINRGESCKKISRNTSKLYYSELKKCAIIYTYIVLYSFY